MEEDPLFEVTEPGPLEVEDPETLPTEDPKLASFSFRLLCAGDTEA